MNEIPVATPLCSWAKLNARDESWRSALRLSEPDDHSALMNRFDTFLFDCDGVIWTGSKLVVGVKEALAILRSRGKKILFVANNSSKSREMYKQVFDGFGIQASVDEIFGSAYASAVYLSKILALPADKKVYLIGRKGLEDELRSVGINFTGGTDSEDRVFNPTEDIANMKNDPSIGAVLCGSDHYIIKDPCCRCGLVGVNADYKKYAKAYTYIMSNPGCEFIITNGDATYPVAGRTFLASGAVFASIQVSTKKTPTIIGKPSVYMMDCILAAHDFDPKRTIMVGDNLETDILFGINSNIATLLVMTGVTNEFHLSGAQRSDIVPDYIVHSIGDWAVLADDMPAGAKT